MSKTNCLGKDSRFVMDMHEHGKFCVSAAKQREEEKKMMIYIYLPMKINIILARKMLPYSYKISDHLHLTVYKTFLHAHPWMDLRSGGL